MVDPPGSLIPNYPTATAGFDPIATSGTQTYTIYVDNIGTQDATQRPRARHPARRHEVPARASGDARLHLQPRRRGYRRHRRPVSAAACSGRKAEFYDRRRARATSSRRSPSRLSRDPVRPAGHAQRGARRPAERDRRDQREQQHRDGQDTVVKTTGGGGQSAFNQLTIVKTATPEVSTSSVITYGVTIGNTGTDPAVNVTFRDVLPAGTAYISASDNNPGPQPVHLLGGGRCGHLHRCDPERDGQHDRRRPGDPDRDDQGVRADPDRATSPTRRWSTRTTRSPRATRPTTAPTPRPRWSSGPATSTCRSTKCDGAPCPSNNNPVAIGHEVTYVITVDERRDRPGLPGRRPRRAAGRSDLPLGRATPPLPTAPSSAGMRRVW